MALNIIRKVNQHGFAILLLLIILVRLPLLRSGVMDIPDEKLYYRAFFALQWLEKGDLHGFSKELFSGLVHPGATFMYLPPAAIQLILFHAGISPESFPSIYIPLYYNFIFSLIVVILFYKLSLHFFRSPDLALLSTLIYALLVNNTIYIRHLLPYDMALMLFLFALLYIDSRNPNLFRSFITGLFIGTGFLVYQGYYLFIPVITLLYIWNIRRLAKKIRVKLIICFFLGNILPFIFLEIFARQIGFSLIESFLYLSKTITQGTFSENYKFFFHYLIQVESYIGIILLSTFLISFISKIYYFISKKTSLNDIQSRDLSILLMVAAYFTHAVLGAVFHRFVFYGRLLHMYMPFLIWGSVSLVSRISDRRLKLIIISILIFTSLHSFISFYGQFLNLGYPRTLLDKFKIETNTIPLSLVINESPVYEFISSSDETSKSLLNQRDSSYVLVNFGFFYPITDVYSPFQPAENMSLIYQRTHFQSFYGYLFEGFSPKERELILSRNYKLSIYALNKSK